MQVWVLIVVMHGWGSGAGSQGNFAGFAEFSSKERCEIAAQHVREDEVRHLSTFCVEK